MQLLKALKTRDGTWWGEGNEKGKEGCNWGEENAAISQMCFLQTENWKTLGSCSFKTVGTYFPKYCDEFFKQETTFSKYFLSDKIRTDQVERDTSHCWQYQEEQKLSEYWSKVLGHSCEFLASLQGREKGKAEWRRSWKRSFVKLRRAKSTPVNMASRIRTLQNWHMNSRLRK